MGYWAKKSILSTFLFAAVASWAQIDTASIVQKMISAQRGAKAQLRAYQATRKYQVFKGTDQKSEFLAEIQYVPPQAKTFSIVQSSGGTAEGIVKRTLEHEVVATRDPRAYEIGPLNYEFAYVGEDACGISRCFLLTITPKRHCKDLIDGKVWIDQKSYLISRVEGDLSKSPSWWVKKASVIVEYGAVDGMWLQIRSVANAKLRFAGDYSLVSNNVDLRSERTLAAVHGSTHSLRRRLASTAVIGEAGFFLPARK